MILGILLVIVCVLLLILIIKLDIMIHMEQSNETFRCIHYREEFENTGELIDTSCELGLKDCKNCKEHK